MAANTQDFRVKHGLQVTNTAAFGNAVSISGNVTISNTKSLIVTGNVVANGLVHAANGILSNSDIRLATGNLTISTGTANLRSTNISGNLVVTGTMQVNSTETLEVGTTKILLASGLTGSDNPDSASGNGGVVINRGSAANVEILWDESVNRWKFTNDGSIYFPLKTFSHLTMTFQTSTVTNVDPGTSVVRMNSSNTAAVTTISVDVNDLAGTDVTQYIDTWDDSNSDHLGYVYIRSSENQNRFAVFSMTGVTSQSGYRQLSVTPLAFWQQNNPFNNLEGIFLEFMRTGEKGQKGQKGEKGQKGQKGEKGERVSSGTYTDSNNTVVFTNSDATTFSISGVKGQKGEQISGVTFTDANNTTKFDQSDGTTHYVTGMKGQKGQKGEVGQKGQKGEQGVKGEKGQKGQKGESFEIAYNFSTGTSETTSNPAVQSLAFNSGVLSSATKMFVRAIDVNLVNNATYLDGFNSQGNSTNRGIITVRNYANTAQTVMFPITGVSNSTVVTSSRVIDLGPNISTGYNSPFPANSTLVFEVSSVSGEKGQKGQKGDTGQKGEKGQKGDKGQKGERVSTATYTDSNNTVVFTNSDTSTFYITGVKGQKGQKGETFQSVTNLQVNSLGVGTAASGTTGEIRATNDITAFYSSDERLKENIETIEHALNKVTHMRGVNFDWNEIAQRLYPDRVERDIGVIAQDVLEVAPEAVVMRDNGYYAVKYDKLVAILIEAVKELQERVEQLESK